MGRGITAVRIARHGAQMVAEEQADLGMKGTSGCWFRPAGANSGCCQAEVYIVKRASKECVCGYTLETRLCGLRIWTIWRLLGKSGQGVEESKFTGKRE